MIMIRIEHGAEFHRRPTTENANEDLYRGRLFAGPRNPYSGKDSRCISEFANHPASGSVTTEKKDDRYSRIETKILSHLFQNHFIPRQVCTVPQKALGKPLIKFVAPLDSSRVGGTSHAKIILLFEAGDGQLLGW